MTTPQDEDSTLPDSALPDSRWWMAFREALLEGDLGETVGGIDPSATGDRVRGALAQWLDAGPGRAIEDRLRAIEDRLAAIEASQAGSTGDEAASQ